MKTTSIKENASILASTSSDIDPTNCRRQITIFNTTFKKKPNFQSNISKLSTLHAKNRCKLNYLHEVIKMLTRRAGVWRNKDRFMSSSGAFILANSSLHATRQGILKEVGDERAFSRSRIVKGTTKEFYMVRHTAFVCEF